MDHEVNRTRPGTGRDTFASEEVRTARAAPASAAGGRRRGRARRWVAAGTAALLLVSAACSTTDDASTEGPAATSTVPADSPPETVPDDALRTMSQDELQSVVDRKATELGVPGAVVLVRSPQGEFVAAHGTTELGRDVLPTLDTHVRIASISKSYTAALILQLAQEGELELTDPISAYVDGVPGGEDITLALLLEMRSGLYNFTNDPRVSDGIDADHGRVWEPQELLDIAFSHPANFEPGAEYEYSNTNYTLLALVAEEVDGKPLAEAYEDRIFGPLGMADTFLPPVDSTTLPEPFSHGYLYGGSGIALGSEPTYTPDQVAAVRDGALQPTDYTGVNHTFAFGAGGLVSTAADQATFWKAFVGGDVLDAEYRQILLDSLKVEDPARPGQLYGYGISALRWGPNGIDYHGGETAGYNLFAGYDPVNDVTLVVWANLTLSVEESSATANALMLVALGQIYSVDPLAPTTTATTTTAP